MNINKTILPSIDFNKINIYRKGLHVERMHTVRHITPYNNGFHSCNAALLAMELCKLNKMNDSSIIKYMLLHDVAEGYTGDIPANVKVDNPDLKHALSAVEKHWEDKFLPDMPDLCAEEKVIAKVADLSELGLYCLEELTLGNKNTISILINVVNYLSAHSYVLGVKSISDYLISRGELPCKM